MAINHETAISYLREKAAEYRRLSQSIVHPPTAAQLAQRAADYERRLAQIQATADAPKPAARVESPR